MKRKLYHIPLLCIFLLLTACGNQVEKKSEESKTQTKTEETTKEENKSEDNQNSFVAEPIETEFVNIRSFSDSLFELDQISGEDLGFYLREYHLARFPYEEEKEVEELLMTYISGFMGNDTLEYQKEHTDVFVEQFEQKLNQIRNEEMLHLGYLERDILQQYLDLHYLYLDSQRTHLKMSQVPFMLGLVSVYRNEVFSDPLAGPKFERLGIEPEPAIEKIRPINSKVQTILERLQREIPSYETSNITSEIETFESYMDELFRQWEDSYSMIDGDEGEGEGEDYLKNFLEHGYERYFHKGLERELKRLEREVLPTVSGEKERALRTYIDYHFLLTQSLILYLEDMSAYGTERVFYNVIANYWSQSELYDDGKTYEGPYQNMKGIMQADYSPLDE